jgi:hypothetical protein
MRFRLAAPDWRAQLETPMSSDADEDAPAPPPRLESRPLFVMRLDVRPVLDVGATPVVHRRIGIVPSGRFAGDRMSGVVLEGGSDWQSIGADGSVRLDVRLVLKTGDGALITMTYRGIRAGPADVLARLDRGEPVGPSDYYFRIGALFETSATRYDWLNRLVAAGSGHRLPDGPIYRLFEIL